ncbi:terminal deoxycytidyl transferase rev1 [Echinococcus multilocularis]|uniref:DNA repair protein REV1 n=1 Tax=Echinococcus multilocularis TaxID=6211 RepID=A0A068XY13_ECHMU|nr:terminal deoxycytidyl transferase rev1 [Echinococcus multilocularis]
MRQTRRSFRDRRDGANAGWDGQGGYMSAKIRKLEAQFAENGQKTSIFSGIRVYVNGHTEPPALEIRRLVQENGGTFVQYYSQSAGDFMVAANLPLSKIKKIGNQKVVRASWITESIAAGQLLPWKNFVLYPSEGELKGQNTLPGIKERLTNLAESTVEQSVSSDVALGKLLDQVSEVSKNDDLASWNDLMSGHDFSTVISAGSDDSSSDASRDSLPSKTVTDSPKGDQVKEKEGTALPTTSDDYIRRYYSRSRLHHLSKWAADLRYLVRSLRLQAQGGSGADGTELLRAEVQRLQAVGEPTELVLQTVGSSAADARPLLPRLLMHIDMDCFFVSVCLRSRPELVGLPVAVTHNKGTKAESSLSEVASCSYEARRFGVTNGMHLGDARKLCPDLRTVPYEFDAFYQVAEVFYKTVSRFCLQIEALSCDEMYVDVTELLGVRKEKADIRLTSPLVLGALLRRHVSAATQCTATCGFGTNRLLARLATKRAKPNSQALLLGSAWRCLDLPSSSATASICELASQDGCRYLDDLPLSQLPGVGRHMVKRIAQTYGVLTCGQLLKAVTHTQLSSLLGAKTSQRILQLCRGNDSSELTLDRYAKSISAEINYGVRLSSWSEVEKFVGDLANELSSRLRNAIAESKRGFGVVGKSLAVHLLTRRPDQPVESAKYLGHGICDNFTRIVPLSKATADSKSIAGSCLSVLRRLDPNPCDIRGLGLQMQRLSPSSPLKSQSCLEGDKLKRDPPVETASSITRFLKPLNLYQSNHTGNSSTSNEDIKDPDSLSDFGDVMSTPSADFDHLSPSEPSSPAHSIERQESPHKLLTESNQEEEENVPLVDLLPHQENRPLEEVNVFAKRSVEELQNMFATWIATESNPLEEDLCMLADYLISILPTDLARVRILLRGLRRLVEAMGFERRTGGDAWRLAFRRLRLTIDSACRRHYDADVLEIDLY